MYLLKGSTSPILRGRALNRLGAVAFYESKWREAETLYERAGRLLERVAPAEAVGALANLALVHLWTGSLGAAREVLTRARAEARRGVDALEEARIDEDLARVLFRLGDGAEAARVLDEAETAYEDFGDKGGIVRVLLTRGQMARERGRLDVSLELLRRGLVLAREGANPFALFDALHLIALTHLTRGERAEAGEALREARTVLGDRLSGRYEALLERAEARLAPGGGGTEEAERKLDRAIRHFLRRGERLMAAETMLHAAQARLESPSRGVPRALLKRAETLMKEGDCPWVSCRLALLGGRCAERRADLPEAASLYREAVRIARGLDARLDLAEALARLGALSAKRGERRRARSYVEEATSLYDRVRIVVPPAPLAEARALLQAPEEEGGESFRVLCRIAEIINSLRDSEAILNHVLDQALDFLRAERGLVLVYGPDGDLVPRVARSLDGAALADATRFSRTLFRRAEESEEPLVADNALADPRFEGADSVSAYNILSVASAPLRSRGKPLGLIYLDNCRSTNLFSPTDISFLVALANLAGVALENARLLEDLERENTLLKSEVQRSAGDEEIIAVSPVMKRALEQLRTAARSDITVLLLGETGTGKGIAAQFLHGESSRRDQPFLRLNCSAVAPTLVEDELFGHDRGAFTDATGRKPGIFERANRGTLLLDEIGDMPLPAQSKLLRVLQEGEFERLGGVQTIRTNIRIIAATNRNLAELVARGEFREDLFYRLNVVAVELPPLRSRREDIPALARIFLDRHARQNRKEVQSISGAAESLLRSYSWPGNVRELDHVVERAVVFCDGKRIEVGHLTEEVRAAFPSEAARAADGIGSARDLAHELRTMEGEILREALQRSDWNRSKAARLLGIHESTVRKKIRLHRLDRFRPRKNA
jgi:transcriptional regulator with GAF, ATPase, and Fis domain